MVRCLTIAAILASTFVARPALAESLIARFASGAVEVLSAADGDSWCDEGIRVHVRVNDEALLETRTLQRAVRTVTSLAETDCPKLASMVVLGFLGSEESPRLSSSAFARGGWALLDVKVTAPATGAAPATAAARETAPLGATETATDRMSREDREFLRALESLAWVPDGPASDRQVYVISAPWCGYCQRLYRNSKDLADLEFRWIKTGARNAEHQRQIASASLSREPRALEAIYLGGKLPKVPDRAAGERIVEIHERAFGVLSEEIKKRNGGGWGFPTLVYASRDGLRVSGASADPESQLVDVLERPEARDMVPVAHRVARGEFDTQEISGMVVGNGAGEGVVRLLPADGAPPVTQLREGRGFEGVAKLTVDGDLWYAVRVFRDGAPGYVRATEARFNAK